MSDKKISQQKKQAQLDEWKAEVDKLRAKLSGATAEAQLKMQEQIKSLEKKIAEGKTKLTEISEASEDAWESMKERVDAAWDSLKSRVNESIAKFKK